MTPSTQRKIIIALIAAGVLIAGFFGQRAIHAFREFRADRPSPLSFPAADAGQHLETDVELIRDWMTIPYIAETYRIPPEFLFDALSVPPRGNEEKSLAQLNEEYSPQAPGIVIEVVKAALRAIQAAFPVTPVPSIVP